MTHRKPDSMRELLARVQSDESGAVSLEHILIIGAIALPILIFMMKFGWPKVRDYYFDGVRDLDTATEKVRNGQ